MGKSRFLHQAEGQKPNREANAFDTAVTVLAL